MKNNILVNYKCELCNRYNEGLFPIETDEDRKYVNEVLEIKRNECTSEIIDMMKNRNSYKSEDKFHNLLHLKYVELSTYTSASPHQFISCEWCGYKRYIEA